MNTKLLHLILIPFLWLTPILVLAQPSMSIVSDIEPGSGSSFPSFFTQSYGKTFFTANTSTFGIEIWSSDLTTGGTSLFKDIVPGAGSWSGSFGVLGEKIVYAVNIGNSYSIYITDGSAAGTQLLVSGLAGATIYAGYKAINGVLYFDGRTAATGRELWRTDGTQAGTYLVKELYPGPVGGNPLNFTQLPNDPSRFILTGGIPNKIWVSDGTTQGTVSIYNDIATDKFTPLGDKLVFCGRETPGLGLGWGLEIYVTDGTPAGTMRITDKNPGTADFCDPQTTFVPFAGHVYFPGNTPATGEELWRTDGTSTGTTLVADLYPGIGSSNPRHFHAFGSRKFIFSAVTPTHPRELYKSSGTAAGTQRVSQITPAATLSSSILDAYNDGRVGNKIGFRVYNQTQGNELWAYNDPNYAIASNVGEGCGPSGFVPRCRATDPIIGRSTTITCENIPSGAVGFLFIGSPAPTPAMIRPGCFTPVDLGQPVARVDSWIQSSSSSTHSTTINIPNVTGLNGQEFAVQLLVVPAAGGAFWLSGGINLLLGSN